MTRITHSSDGGILFEFEIPESSPEVPPEALTALAWELDIGRWEMTRTHWAVKDVDVFTVLQQAGVLTSREASALRPRRQRARKAAVRKVTIAPSVFAVPVEPVEPDLVAVMMPFADGFSGAYEAIQRACRAAGFRCKRVDEVWNDSTIIQDVFSLIYRSAVVVVDLTGRNSNVMYETGIAHTLGREVVPISQATDSLPFDLAHHRTLGYTADTAGLAAMSRKLETRLRTLAGSVDN